MNKKRKISFGDRIFARVTRNGRTIFNFVSEKVANMTDLVGQLRQAMRDIEGLVMLHIRNYNQGWGEERPLMLYAREDKRRPFMSVERRIQSVEPETPQMIFPWDTH